MKKYTFLLSAAVIFFLAEGAWAQAAPVASQLPQLFIEADRCLACHNGLQTPDGRDVSIGEDWGGSIMAHSSLDPYWQASVRRETIDHPQSRAAIEDECSACHMPMMRYNQKTLGQKGQVFIHLPFKKGAATGDSNRLAADGVSCSICHQIEKENLGEAESFTGGFEVDTTTPLGQRPIYGPYEVDPGRRTVMRSATRVEPIQSKHVQQSALCATCHTLYTHARGAEGEIVGTLPEQVPYLEWLHSRYPEVKSCQSCHMPVENQPVPITSVLGQPREEFSRHVFRGGNFFMQRLLAQKAKELGVGIQPDRLQNSARITAEHLQNSAVNLTIENAAIKNGRLQARLTLVNQAGHKVPTAYPSRRAWIHFQVLDQNGGVVFESGALNPEGSIVGNENDLDPDQYERHYQTIRNKHEVQIYEPILETAEGGVTTGLLSGVGYKKDNRLLPQGFDKETASEDIAVHGNAAADKNFSGGGDTITYSVPIRSAQGPFTVRAEFVYQPIGFRWAHNLKAYESLETDRFVSYYASMAELSSIILAQDSLTIQ